jgi:hypothetical protein
MIDSLDALRLPTAVMDGDSSLMDSTPQFMVRLSLEAELLESACGGSKGWIR